MTPPIIIFNASKLPLVTSPEIKINGESYFYVQEVDALVQEKYRKKLKELKWPKFVEWVKEIKHNPRRLPGTDGVGVNLIRKL